MRFQLSSWRSKLSSFIKTRQGEAERLPFRNKKAYEKTPVRFAAGRLFYPLTIKE
jgi:hypothetical protein